MTLVREESEAHHRAIVEAAIDAIVAIDEHGIVQSFNPAAERLFGYSLAEVLGQNVSMLMPQPYRGQHDGYVRRYLETGERRIIGLGREVVGQRKNGSTFPMHLSVFEVQTGTRRLFAGMVRDLTREKEAERARNALVQRLERTNAELERFTYTVSHDLKSPLITIKGFLGTLEEDARAGQFDRMARDIARIASAADKMQQLLGDLLELSRIGRVANPSAEVSLTELAREAKEMLAGLISDNGAEVRVPPDLPTVYGDRMRLREVLQNLIENSLKFARSGIPAVIEIDASLEDDTVSCTVRDNGVGFDPDYRDTIFNLFEQLEQGTGGSGIGLALVKRIVEVHGGRIWAESEGTGTGATFHLTLPRRGPNE